LPVWLLLCFGFGRVKELAADKTITPTPGKSATRTARKPKNV